MILVMTPHWLESKWCFAEFAQARGLGKAIFPLIVAPTGETIVGGDLQRIDLVSDRAGGLDRLASALTTISQSSPEAFDLPKGTAPFPGLAAFEERQAAVFFGRDAEIGQAIDRLRVARTIGSRKLLLVVGASGSGKSSLLRAGLLPRLRREREAWIVLPPFRPGSAPKRQLIDCLLSGLAAKDPGGAVTAEHERERRTALDGPAPADSLDEIARALRRAWAVLDASILLPIDQLEEVFTLASPDAAAAFFAFLGVLLDGSLPFVAVATARSDHLDNIQKAGSPAVPYELFPLAGMPIERVGALLRGPARVIGLGVEDDLVTTLMHDAEIEDALPLVAVTLEELFRRFGRDGRLTLAAYESLGDRDDGLSPLGATVRKRAEAALEGLDESPSDAAALKETFLTSLVRVSRETGRFVRRPAVFDRLPASVRPLIERLVEARVLVRRAAEAGDPDGMTGAGAVVEVAHEALFRVWPRLASWLTEEREFLIGSSRIRESYEDWAKLDAPKKAGGLLSGVQLDRARQWLADHPARFADEDERAYVEQSDAAARAVIEAQQRAQHRLIAALAGIVIVLLAGLLVSGLFYKGQVEEAARADAARAAALETANGLIFDLVQKFRGNGLPNRIVVEIQNQASELQDRRIEGETGDLKWQRSRAAAIVELANSLGDFGNPGLALSRRRHNRADQHRSHRQ